MPMEPTIRRAVTADANCLAALAIQVWLHTYATDGIRPALADYVLTEFTEQRFTERINDPMSVLLVAEIKQHLVAYALLSLHAPCRTSAQGNVELATLYVQAHFAGTGLGSALLKHSQAWLRQGDAQARVWLSVWTHNPRAIDFYRKHQFEQVGTTQFEFGGERHENLVLLAPGV